ncbi:hypothetical protein HAZT_HAZT004073 [Hyalella azteca]|uniref:M7GpppX diphosphatase n=1 Tax=Hyalella azteca TaxID=294128 RepID=A0A6A0GV89_HYAAZ|nr:hypothetical protein HAZT_HAZT004073 [Hyalella azteca]
MDDKCEADRVILRDSDPLNGFVLLSDMKWTGEKLSDLFCQAIVNRRDLASLRDLTRDCLPLLYNIRDKGTMAIEEKYGVKANQLRVYLHYLPSFYHLHVHFASINSCHEGRLSVRNLGCMEYGKVHPLDMRPGSAHEVGPKIPEKPDAADVSERPRGGHLAWADIRFDTRVHYRRSVRRGVACGWRGAGNERCNAGPSSRG